ncbi:nitric oxide synthase [Coniochaeta sp. 2T2.1]|nr:nitric oxide synthase [Coniochaeta sp. 2T2.1]
MSCPFTPRDRPPAAQEEFDRINKYYPRLATTSCTEEFYQSGRMIHTTEPRVGQDRSSAELTLDAIDFLNQLRRDGIIVSDDALARRIEDAKSGIRSTSKTVERSGRRLVRFESVGGIWEQTFREIEHGVKLCWKHSKRCIMRSEYESIKVVDFRHIKKSKEMAEALVEGLVGAHNQGDITVTAFIFPPRQAGKTGPMIWNDNLLSYAGYRQPDGTILGNASTVALTEAMIHLGWKPPKLKTRWDLLPIVTMAEDNSPYIQPIPEDLFPSVEIIHPREQYALPFQKLGLRWTCAAALSRMGFDIGGVQYTVAPFTGYWMDAEVAVRNLTDEHGSYNFLPSVVKALGLLDKGQALDDLPAYQRLAKLQIAQSELTCAVNWSYRQAKVRIIDTLTASNMYCEFDKPHLAEKGFRFPADPYWLSPPQGSIIPLWHQGGAPNYQPKPMVCRHAEDPVKSWKRRQSAWGFEAAASAPTSETHNEGSNRAPALAQGLREQGSTRYQLRIYYCSSGTIAFRLAQRLKLRLESLCKSSEMAWTVTEPAPLNDLRTAVDNRDCILIIASSSGRGQVPANGVRFVREYSGAFHLQAADPYERLPRYAIFGNGNSTYGRDYNGAALKIDKIIQRGNLLRFVNSIRFALDLQEEIPPEVHDLLEGQNILKQFHTTIQGLRLARCISSTPTENRTLKRVELGIDEAGYADMSHINVHVPVNDVVLESLLFILKLTGKEPVDIPNTKGVISREVLSLVDLDKPFTHTRWVAGVRLQLSEESLQALLRQSSRVSLQSAMLKGAWKRELVTPENLSTFCSALPLRKPRTFSVASSSSYKRMMGSSETRLDLVVRIHPGGLFTDRFLSGARLGSPLYITIRPGPGEHLRREHRPLIAFCTGSGVAPLQYKDIVSDSPWEWATPELVDLKLCSSDSPGIRIQNRMFESMPRQLIRCKIVEQEASVFVCASREPADDFAVNLEAIVGVPDIREALGDRWI